MHGRLKPLNDLTRRHSSGKNRPGAVHGSSQHSVTNTSNISAQARQFRPRRVHKLGSTIGMGACKATAAASEQSCAFWQLTKSKRSIKCYSLCKPSPVLRL